MARTKATALQAYNQRDTSNGQAKMSFIQWCKSRSNATRDAANKSKRSSSSSSSSSGRGNKGLSGTGGGVRKRNFHTYEPQRDAEAETLKQVMQDIFGTEADRKNLYSEKTQRPAPPAPPMAPVVQAARPRQRMTETDSLMSAMLSTLNRDSSLRDIIHQGQTRAGRFIRRRQCQECDDCH